MAVNYRIQIVPEVQQKNDLLHWWWFDEAVANKLGDGIGEENGSLQGNATWSADSIYGTSLNFKDIGDRAELGAVSNNLNGGKFGLSFWFRRTEESFNWSSNLVSNVMVGLGDENGTVLEIGSKGKAIDLFLATEIKTTQISIGSEIRDDHWHFLSLSYDENASDESELKVFLDGKLLGATGEFGGSLKVQSSDEWILGTASLQNPELGRFIGKIDDFRVYDSEISDSLHQSTYNLNFGDLSLTVESDYNSTTHQNPIIANLTFKRYGQDWPVEFNATRIESENTSDIIVSGSGAHWTLEFNSTVDRGRLNIEIMEAAGIDQSGRISKPHSIQIGYGRPIVALNHLSAWWTFDEGNGTEVHDYFGKYVGTFDGVNGASVSFDASRSMFGSSLYFPQDAWVTTNAYAVDLGIDGQAERTISFWMYTENQIVDQPGVYGIGRRYWSDGSNHGIWAIRGFWDTDNYRRFNSSHWGYDPQVFVSEGVKNKWVHVAHQYDSDRNVIVYVNGLLRFNNQKKGMDTQNYFPLQIGRWTEETSGWVIKDGRHRRSYKGWIDDFRVYDAALSGDEILQIYGNGSGDFQVVAALEIDPIVDGDTSLGRIRFTRNQKSIADLDFNLSNDLLMTGGDQ